jgi:hypothetical protein
MMSPRVFYLLNRGRQHTTLKAVVQRMPDPTVGHRSLRWARARRWQLLRSHGQPDVCLPLQSAEDGEEVLGAGFALVAEHPMQALAGHVDFGGETL